MALIEWSDEFSVASPSMDEHHRRLFDIINRLHEAIETGRGAEAGPLISELIDYTRYHFAAEETLLESSGYQELDAHRAEHRRFVADLAALRELLRSGLVALAASRALGGAVAWLEKHILVTDRRYAGVI